MKETTRRNAPLRRSDLTGRSWELSPAERAAMSEPQRCDFCRGRLIVRVYRCPLASPLNGIGASPWGAPRPGAGSWGACRVCAALIDAADGEAVLRRVLTALTAASRRERGAEPEQTQIEQAQQFCNQFFACHSD